MTNDKQDVNEFWHMTQGQLKNIIDAFAEITWPAPADAVNWLLVRLGWERVRLRVARMDALAQYGAASIGLADSEREEDALFDTLRFAVTDIVAAPSGVQMYQTMVGWISEIIESPVATREPSPYPDAEPDFPTAWWDLNSGGGVQLYFINGAVKMELMSKDTAEGERFDRDHPEYTDS